MWISLRLKLTKHKGDTSVVHTVCQALRFRNVNAFNPNNNPFG